jgi:hypothetical protein
MTPQFVIPNFNKKKRVALLIRGGVAKSCGQLLYPGDIYKPSQYVNYRAVKKSIDKHIINANPGYEFDIFLHCWSYDIQNELVDLYQPTAYWFEDNNQYTSVINNAIADPKSFACASQTLSTTHGCRIIKMHSDYIQKEYDLVIVYRFDMLLWKDMDLDQLDLDYLYVNNWDYTLYGDFHVIFKGSLLDQFAKIFYTLGPHNPASEHSILTNFVNNHLKCSMRHDDILVVRDQCVIRRLGVPLSRGLINEEKMLEYGLSLEELQTYRDI